MGSRWPLAVSGRVIENGHTWALWLTTRSRQSTVADYDDSDDENHARALQSILGEVCLSKKINAKVLAALEEKKRREI